MNEQQQTTLKGYELKEQIGKGGFGAVYRAYQPAIAREVALKVILPEFANSPDFIRRFEVEAQTIARLESPHIVPLYDYWRDPNGAYLVMRSLRSSLAQSLRDGPWSPENAARLLEQVASALTVAHRAGVIHRDIKPDNILLDEDDNAYLADFGIAKDMTIATTSRDGVTVGSPAYMTPEQIRGEAVSPQTDIYSLGLVLYEILVNQKPFGLDGSLDELISQQLFTPLRPLHEQRPSLPTALSEVLHTATAKKPEDRYPNVSRFAQAFRAALPARSAGQPLAEALTGREMDILRLMVEGLSNGEIALKLVLSLETVRWYVKQLYIKLDVHSRRQAIERALRLKLLEPVNEPSIEDSILTLHSRTLAALEVVNPYKGLRAFQEADVDDFFGRSALVESLVRRLDVNWEQGHLLVVVGPSGSGKSSVVRAGLLPSLRRGAVDNSQRWFITDMLPGTHPLEELEAALLRVSVMPVPGLLDSLNADERGLVRAAKRILPNESDVELLLVIDQFEELFTLTADEKARQHFIRLLLAAVGDERSRIRLVLTIRADFYDRPLMYPELVEPFSQNTQLIAPLSAPELTEAILAPAERAGLKIEPRLVNTILNDINEQPGALPLLQFALTELYERRQDNTLTLDAYQQLGGISGALARRADELYQQLVEDEQLVARQLFLRLITLGEGTEDTRRRVLQAELSSLSQNERLVDDVIGIFGRYRLLTLDRDPISHGPTVEIAHEALIHEWGRLHDWLQVSREDIRVQRRLAAAAAEWRSAGDDRSYLARGSRLDQFEGWARETTLALSADERAYLEASLVEQARWQTADEARKAHEAQIARRAQNFGRAAAVLAVVGVLAILATIFAVTQAAHAQSQVLAADTQVADANATLTPIPVTVTAAYATVNGASLKVAAANATLMPIPATLTEVAQQVQTSQALNQSLQLAAQADGILQDQYADKLPAVLLSIRALRAAYSPQADAALVKALDSGFAKQWFLGNPQLYGAIFSPDGHYVLTLEGDWAKLRNLATGQLVRTFFSQSANSGAFSRDGRYLVLTNGYSTALWDVASGQPVRSFDCPTCYASSVAFSPNGRYVLTGNGDNSAYGLGNTPDYTARLWDVASEQVVRTFTGHTGAISGVAFSPDGRTVLTSSSDKTARLWDVATGQQLHTFADFTDAVTSVAFSPDGRTILAGSADKTARLWDVATGQTLRVFSGHMDVVNSVAFSPDGRTVLTGSSDKTARLWDVATGQQVRMYAGHTDKLKSVVFSPDGRTVLTASDDGTARLWDMAAATLLIVQGPGTPVPCCTVAHVPLRWAGGAVGAQVLCCTWDFLGRDVSSVAFSPNGRYALTLGWGHTDLWDLATDQLVRSYKDLTYRFFTRAVFSPDGRYILGISRGAEEKDSPTLWDVATGEQVRTFQEARDSYSVNDVAFSPDGRYVLADAGHAVRLWEAATGQLVREFSGHTNDVISVAFSPDGRTVLTGSYDQTARLWDVATGQPLHIFNGHTSIVNSVAFSPDGRTILTGSNDHTARLWDVATGQTLRIFSGHNHEVTSVVFSPDGRTILTGSRADVIYTANHLGDPAPDTSARLWDVDYRQFIAYACTQVWRDFTDTERQQLNIDDSAPTCPQFAGPGTPTPVMPPGTPPIGVTLPASTAIASPTPSATLPPNPDIATPTGFPYVVLTFTPSPTSTPGASPTQVAYMTSSTPTPTLLGTPVPTATLVMLGNLPKWTPVASLTPGIPPELPSATYTPPPTASAISNLPTATPSATVTLLPPGSGPARTPLPSLQASATPNGTVSATPTIPPTNTPTIEPTLLAAQNAAASATATAAFDFSSASLYTEKDNVVSLKLPKGWRAACPGCTRYFEATAGLHEYEYHTEASLEPTTGDPGVLAVEIGDLQAFAIGFRFKYPANSPQDAANELFNQAVYPASGPSGVTAFTPVQAVRIGSLDGYGFTLTTESGSSARGYDIRLAALPNGKAVLLIMFTPKAVWDFNQETLHKMADSLIIKPENLLAPTLTPTPRVTPTSTTTLTPTVTFTPSITLTPSITVTVDTSAN